MIPTTLAHQLRQGLEAHMRAMFPVATPVFRDALPRLLADEQAWFRGPYVTLALPFQPGTADASRFTRFTWNRRPHRHQEIAFDRLLAPEPASTIIATGTGSGKTECFLLPILEHVARARADGLAGVKAILVYPMNALATDQARRLAELVHGDPGLKGRVTAGLYVGDAPDEVASTMTATSLITDRETLRQHPPDILLTNYKMLDLLLVRPRDARLWRHNRPGTLRFLVVDELHTFDGAQGTDLACLVRRLEARLGAPGRPLCVVGTSATLGHDASRDALARHATELFGQPIGPEAIVGETRLDLETFLALDTPDGAPPPEAPEPTCPEPEPLVRDLSDPACAPLELARRLAPAFWPAEAWPSDDRAFTRALARLLRPHPWLEALLRVLGGRTLPLAELAGGMARRLTTFADAPATTRKTWLVAFLALVAAARVSGPDPAGADAPFLPLVRVQFWLREWRQVVASVANRPALRFAPDLAVHERDHHLPVVHCRDCGATGWVGLRPSMNATHVAAPLERIYDAYFGKRPEVTFCYPDAPPPGARPKDGLERLLCPRCMHLHDPANGDCPACGPVVEAGGEPGDPDVPAADAGSLVRVWVPDHVPAPEPTDGTGARAELPCGHCGQTGGVTLMGARAATLTSVVIDQLFVGRANDDKKLLTFSDSVQDAAHRASFFEARTHGIVRRAALARAIDSHRDAPTLAELPLRTYETLAASVGRLEAIWRLLPPDMHDLPDLERGTRAGTVEPGSRLERMLLARLGWEVLREFGLRAGQGRSLEKVGFATAHLPPGALNRATARVAERLVARGGLLESLTRLEIKLALRGWVRLLLARGAVLDPVTRRYLEEDGKTYLAPRIGFHLGGPDLPTFPATVSHRDHLQALVGPMGRPNRLERWIARAWRLDERPLLASAIREALPEMARLLVAEGLFGQIDTARGRAWGLLAEQVAVTKDVTRVACTACHLPLHAPSHDEDVWEGAPCLRDACSGTYRVSDGRPFEAIRRFYETGDVTPVVAREHTGLLDRSTRETLETGFKRQEGRTARDPNVLSCTPTFEMGLDVGDLSSVILCQVPPAQANTLQRIGRAGRRDGNALVVTIATNRAHDLYFYADPLEMIAGEVQPPGIHLGAARVLERQLAAFAFDRWVQSDPGDEAVPETVREVLSAWSRKQTSRFPLAFTTFVDGHATELFEAFVARFPGMAPEVRDALEPFLSTKGPETLAHRLQQALEVARDEITGHKQRKREVEKALKTLEDHPARPSDYETRRQELRRERDTLESLVRQLEQRTTYGHLTDEGILPNYAFPEEGIRLKSIIWRRNDDREDASGGTSRREVEYQRPASAALGELAPRATFYAEGRKVQIDQVDLATTKPEAWRFCPECSHAARDVGDRWASCPRCGHPGWADTGQVHEMLRLRQVFATTPETQSRSDDRSDDREQRFFERRFLVSVDPDDVASAHELVEGREPFGVEFVQQATFRDINSGEQRPDGTPLKVAGHETRAGGFSVCSSCGKVRLGKKPRHALGCKHHGTEDGFDRVLFLYREFRSEAVRILLPLADLEDDTRVQSFIAAFQLGLRKRFGGRVDHLRAALQEEALPDQVGRRRYLVLYDTVPGGTGYLRELGSDPEQLMEVLRAALAHLKACNCRLDDTRDGCYRCLFAHRVARVLDRLSRREAIDLLVKLVGAEGKPGTWVRIDSVAEIGNMRLIDSALERGFLRALAREKRVRLEATTFPEGTGWHVTVLPAPDTAGPDGPDAAGAGQVYRMRAQFPVHGDRGGLITVPDFALWPEKAASTAPGLAIYLDGYQFHRDQVAGDARKRLAIGAMAWQVWTLTHHDLPHEGQQAPRSRLLTGPGPEQLLDLDGLPMVRNLDAMVARFMPGTGRADARDLLATPAWTSLLARLARPGFIGHEATDGEGIVRTLAHLAVEPSAGLPPGALATWAGSWTSGAALEAFEDVEGGEPGLVALRSQGGLHVAFAGPLGKKEGTLTRVLVLEARAGDRDREAFQRAWLGFWRLWNLLQGRTGWVPIVETGGTEAPAEVADDREPRHAPSGRSEPGIPATGSAGIPATGETSSLPRNGQRAAGSGDLPAAWRTVLDDLGDEPGTAALCEELAARGWEVPEVGLDLMHGSRVLGTGELVWSDRKVALCRSEDLRDVAPLAASGWTLLALEEVLQDPGRLAEPSTEGALAP